MKKHYGFVIVEVYNYKGKQERPVSVSSYKDEETGKIEYGTSGYMYIYPLYKIAEIDLLKLKWGNFRIKRVLIEETK